MTKNILVIKHSAFGDFIQALGVMRAIRLQHKDAKITLLTTSPFVGLASQTGYFDAVVVDTRPKWFQLAKISALKRFLNQGNFSRVYDLQNSERTSLYTALFKKKPEWNGIAHGASHQLVDDDARRRLHVFDALRAQVAVAGIVKVNFDNLSWIDADVFPFRLPRPYVLIAAGCSKDHPQKRWPVQNYVAVCKWLLDQKLTPVLLGTKDDADVNLQIKKDVPGVIDLTDQTSLQQIAVMARTANAALGNDTGPIQMIGPTGCKTLALFPGFSNPKRHGPLGANVQTIQKNAMADIKPEEVRAVLSQFLGISAA